MKKPRLMPTEKSLNAYSNMQRFALESLFFHLQTAGGKQAITKRRM
jgi:hypothetical protein